MTGRPPASLTNKHCSMTDWESLLFEKKKKYIASSSHMLDIFFSNWSHCYFISENADQGLGYKK